jgi:hypothetical protein
MFSEISLNLLKPVKLFDPLNDAYVVDADNDVRYDDNVDVRLLFVI